MLHIPDARRGKQLVSARQSDLVSTCIIAEGLDGYISLPVFKVLAFPPVEATSPSHQPFYHSIVGSVEEWVKEENEHHPAIYG